MLIKPSMPGKVLMLCLWGMWQVVTRETNVLCLRAIKKRLSCPILGRVIPGG